MQWSVLVRLHMHPDAEVNITVVFVHSAQALEAALDSWLQDADIAVSLPIG